MPRYAQVILSILVVLVLAVVIVPFIANIQFSQKAAKEVNTLFSGIAEDKSDIIQPADLEGLPASVRKWLTRSQVIGKERIKSVRLKQSGTMRLEAEQSWMPFEAEQYFATEAPGFIWKAKVIMAPFLSFAGIDKYFDGKGNMLIKMLALIRVVEAQGPEIDQGTVIRYLAETVWFPTAALSNYIKWAEIDANSARATMSYGGVTASGVFAFNEQGEPVSFTAKRYMEVNGQYTLETWTVSMLGHKEINGISIPHWGEVIWKLQSGDFKWFQWEIKEIEYNKPSIY